MGKDKKRSLRIAIEEIEDVTGMVELVGFQPRFKLRPSISGEIIYRGEL